VQQHRGTRTLVTLARGRQGKSEKEEMAEDHRRSTRIRERLSVSNRHHLDVPIAVKEIVFIRHGHSLGQAASRHDRKHDDGLIDADLSHKGKSQAHELAKVMKINEVNPQLILSSPLTRAMKTALIVFDGRPVVVHPGLAELNSHKPIPENKGRSLKELSKDESLANLGFTNRVDLSEVDGTWPLRTSDVDGIEYLRNRIEERVVIFSHHNYILHKIDGAPPHGIHNCSPVSCNVEYFATGHRVKLSSGEHSWCKIAHQEVDGDLGNPTDSE